MKVIDLIEKYSFSPVCIEDGNREIHGGYVGDLLSWVMGKAQQDNAWITIMSNVNVVAVAALADVSTVIMAEGVMPDNDVVEKAKAKGINIVSSELGAFDIVALIAGDV